MNFPRGKSLRPHSRPSTVAAGGVLTSISCLSCSDFMPGAIWGGVTFVRGSILLFFYLIAAAMVMLLLGAWASQSFRCPVCEMTLNRGSGSRLGLSPERRAALYGRYHWCDGYGTRFEIYPNAIFPPEAGGADPEEASEDKDDNGLRVL